MSLHRELLTSGDDSDGVVHAFYASAERTLCNLRRPERTPGESPRPTCEVCAQVAADFDRIDGSRPAHWRGEPVLREAAAERLGPDGAASPSIDYRVRDAQGRWGCKRRGCPGRSRQSRGALAYLCDEHGAEKTIEIGDRIRVGMRRGRARATVSERDHSAEEAPPSATVEAAPAGAPAAEPRSEIAAIPPGGASHDVARAVLAAGRAFVETLERELLDQLEEEAA